VALVVGDERITYAAWNAAANRLAAALVAGGVERGDRVVVFGDNTTFTCIAFWAVLKANAVVSVINAVIHDIGLACTHACAARQEIADGKLVVIETDPPLPPVPIKLMIHQKTMCRELIEALMSTLIVGEDQLNLPRFCSPHLPTPKQSAKQTA
jgi:acyl-coenzyme A synthetase/AMP-(fatty) acid ligase